MVPPLFLLSPLSCYTKAVDLPDLLRTVLPYLRPAEQAVYLRLWHLAGGQGTCSVRYDDLCRSAHVSTSTLKSALKVLAQKNHIKVTFQASHPLSGLGTHSHSHRPTNPGLHSSQAYDFFSADDRSLFFACKRVLSLATFHSLEEEAGGDPYQLDLLLMQQVFGSDRQQKYIHLTKHPVQNDRANPFPSYNV